MNKNKSELQRLQEEKDSCIEEFLDNLMEEKVMKQKSIEKEFKASQEKKEDSIEIEREETLQNTKEEPTLEERLSQLKEEFVEKKRLGLNELKSKYNQLSLQIKLDSK